MQIKTEQGKGGERMLRKISVEVDGLENLNRLLAEHEELCKKLYANTNAIEAEVLQISVKINQPMAATND